MMLATAKNTVKHRTEFKLLISLRFACLLARTDNVMDCPRVKTRLGELMTYLIAYLPSPVFAVQYIGRSGELGRQFALNINFNAGTAKIINLGATSNVFNIQTQQA